MKRVWISIPSYTRKLSAHTTMALAQTLVALPAAGWEAQVICQVGDALLPRCRNHLLAKFRESGYDAWFSIDDDIQWKAKDFISLLERKEDFVCGVYRTKEETVRFPARWVEPENWNDGLIEATHVPFGFVRLTRKVVDTLWALPAKQYKEGEDTFKELFNYGVAGGIFWGEDYVFCNKWRGLGESIWVDPEIELTHYGDFGFKARPSMYLKKSDKDKTLVVALATRGKPKILLENLHVYEEHIKYARTRIVVLADADDTETVEALEKANLSERVIVQIEKRAPSFGCKWNLALKVPGDVYMAMADYLKPATQDFDKIVLEAADFPDGIGCVYGLPANASFPMFQAPTKKLTEMLGGIYPPHFPYWFVDHWLDDICQIIGRISPAEVVIDRSKRGGTTNELRDLGFWAAFYDGIAEERFAQAREIIDSPDFEEPEWRKKILRKNWIRTEVRSQWINELVRNGAAQIEASRGDKKPPDARYLALKALAMDKLRSLQKRAA